MSVFSFVPGFDLLCRSIATDKVQRLLGFWLIFHLYGPNCHDIVDAGLMSRASYFRQRSEFRQVFGLDVDEFAPDIVFQSLTKK